MDPRSQRFRAAPNAPILHCLHWGDDAMPPLVLLHGGGANAWWWAHIAPRLARRFHVLALDFRGHGDSEHPQALRAGAFGEDLAHLLAHLGADEAVLIGASMGAHVALEHAAQTEGVRAMALLDPARGGSDPRRNRRYRLALAFRRSHPSREDAIGSYRFLPPADAAPETLRHAIAAHSVTQLDDGRWGYKFDPRWFTLQPRPRPDAGNVRCPTLVVRGEHSTILTPEGARELCAELPRGELVEIAGAGHHVALDRPEAVLTALGRFLESHVPG